MAWDDPSPRTRAMPAANRPSAPPGYGAPEIRLSFMTILGRTAVALLIGACVYEGVRSIAQSAIAGRHPVMDVALPLAVAVIAGWLLLRFLLRSPPSVGGRGWFGRRRGWDDRYDSTSFGEVVVGEAVGAVIDAALD